MILKWHCVRYKVKEEVVKPCQKSIKACAKIMMIQGECVKYSYENKTNTILRFLFEHYNRNSTNTREKKTFRTQEIEYQ